MSFQNMGSAKSCEIDESLNPIWTIQSGSLFILSILAKDLFAGDGLFCRVVDYDVLSSDDLGYFVVPPDVLYKGNGERVEFKLKAPPRSKGDVPGHLAIRCRRATQYDKDFMEEFRSSEAPKTSTLSVANLSEGGKSNLMSIIEKRVMVDKTGIKKVSQTHRTKVHVSQDYSFGLC
jgi:hypothetical protein